ncbi:MAG TPA: hypothetical protein VJQ43_00560 [Thermoplasmata archaeon]|nr:hypothetical protein [Thermoplasmata archaeon]
MRKGLVIIGVILLIVGVAAAGLTYQQTQTLSQIPSSGSIFVASIGSVTDGSMTLAWSGGNASSVVSVYQCSSATCANLGPQVARGSGGSGSVTFSIAAGGFYGIDSSGGSALSATVTTDGFVPLTFIGVALAAIGAFMLVLGAMARARVRPAPAEVPEPTGSAASEPGLESGAGASATAAEGDQGYIMQAAKPAADPPQSPGQMIKCASCGTLNEMWLHNCRWCKRPLTTTAGSG